MTDQSSEGAEAVTTEQDRVTAGRYASIPSGERCTNCQAPLASDQRYCVNCGERRGRSRFSAESFMSSAAPETAPAPVRAPRRPRASSGATLLAGVATLLVAMGVGVLIGHDSGNSPNKTVAAGAPQVINVGGGSGSGSGSSSSTKGKKSKAKKVKVVHVTKKVAAKATAAAAKVLGGSKALAPATVQPGGACTNGQAGCQNGKFTGNFFGGG